jgi:type I restriction enzyme, S subunit
MRDPKNQWGKTTLGDHADVQTGYPFRSQSYTDDPTGVRLLRGDNIVQGCLRWDGVKRWPSDDAQGYAKYLLTAGDVVVAMDRPWIEAGLKYAWIGECDFPCLLVQRVARLRGTNGLRTSFLRYLIAHKAFTDYVKGIWTGVAVPHISESQIRAFPITLPPIVVQERIVNILCAYDDMIENNTRRIKILEEMAQLIYREWFVNFRFPGHERVKKVESEFGPIPSGWAYEPLEEGCQRITDGSHWSPKTVHVGFPMASVKDMNNWGFDLRRCRKITSEDFENLVRNDCKPLVGDVLIAKDGSYLKHCFWVQKPMEVVILSSIAILRPNELLKSSYLSLHLLDPQIKSRMAGYVSGVALPRIILKDFRNFRILLPPLDIQMDFARLIEPMLRLCWNFTEQNATLRDTRDLLLPKLVSGETCVDQVETESTNVVL